MPSPFHPTGNGKSDRLDQRLFPGMLWYVYEYTGKEEWKARAERATALLEMEQFNAFDHDIGFKMYCSYGNGWRLTRNPDYSKIIFRSAKI